MYVALGAHEEALALLEEAYRKRDDGLTRLKVDRDYDPLREEPRFQDLMGRMNFPG